MIDVGAHFGTSHQEYLESGWVVYAFEPDPDNQLRLRPHQNLVVSNCALGAEDKKAVEFYSSTESTGISGLSPFTPGHSLRCVVDVRTLTGVLHEFGVTKVDYLKIDTEGHDLFVLQGTPWDRIAPDVVMCEFEDRKTKPLGYSYTDLGDFLVDRGYDVFMSEWAPIVRYGVAHEWRRVVRYPATTLEPNAWGNFLAFRRGLELPATLVRLPV